MPVVPPAASHVVITGASSGLGAALARCHAKPGILITICGRNKERLARVAAECVSAGAEVASIVCDVTEATAMAEWLTKADEARSIDILYANAGIGGMDVLAPAEGESNQTAQLIFRTNTFGVINTATPLLPRFVKRRSGHLVVISSLAGLLGMPHSPAYCGSKAAVRIYAEGLRRLLVPHGVRVTVINPGFVDTPMSRTLPVAGPLIWTAERAALAIKSAVENGKREFSFPWSLKVAVALACALPNRLVDAVLAKAYSPAS